MSLHTKYGLSRVINCAGPLTPIGVSRSSDAVRAATAQALASFYVIAELQDVVGRRLADWAGSQSGTVTHCSAASITLAVAAAMAGQDPEKISALPGNHGMSNRVVIPAGHVINYGHSILQAIRLAGATPVDVGTDRGCSAKDLETALAQARTACLVLVSSRLTRGVPVDLMEAVAIAHRLGVPVVIDAAAQDLRVADLVASGADLVLLSGQKYLASPTAGLVVGTSEMIAAVRAQEKGIGRAMKASKEAIAGVLAALEDRAMFDDESWRAREADKASRFAGACARLPGVIPELVKDQAGMPFSRVHLSIDPQAAAIDARALAKSLKSGLASVWAMEHLVDDGQLVFELSMVDEAEMQTVMEKLRATLSGFH